MTFSIIISIITIVLMILSILFFPKIKFKKISVDSYWVIVLIGAIILLCAKQADVGEVGKALISDTAINPIKILILFISMTFLSIFIDELGFFSYMAQATLKRAKASQKKLFLYLYLIVSVLTVFTSNDIIILSFTPFICYFCKRAKISALPYLSCEFVAANTWSMALIIGNPTNIYLATAYGIDFISYFTVMWLPTLLAGLTAFIMLFLLFRKSLSQKTSCDTEDVKIKNKPLLIVGLIHMGVCTITLAVGSYIGIEMWLVSLCSMISLIICVLIVSMIKKTKPMGLGNTVKRVPYNLIPFVLSMFVIILVLKEKGITEYFANLLGENLIILKYGITSFLASNAINNIPMSVLFCSIIEGVPTALTTKAVFASVIGSNLGALFTPIGALAGIMFSSMLHRQGIKFGYLSFIKMGIVVAIPTLIVSLLSLNLMLI